MAIINHLIDVLILLRIRINPFSGGSFISPGWHPFKLKVK